MSKVEYTSKTLPPLTKAQQDDLERLAAMPDGGGDTDDMPELTAAQLDYTASDVLYLHQLKAAFDVLLQREDRTAVAQACFDFLPTRAALDLHGWPETDIFTH